MPTPRQAYIKALDDIARRFVDLDDDTIRQLTTYLQELRKGIATTLLDGGGDLSSFQISRLQEMQRNIDLLIDDFANSLTPEVRGNIQQLYILGNSSVTEPLQAVGISGIFNEINPAQLNVALDFSATLIHNISDEMRSRINAQLALSVLGQESPFVAMRKITDILGIKAFEGEWGRLRRPVVVRGIAARAEAIFRTETTRIFNLAAHSQQLEASKSVPELQKQWMATGDKRTRLSHLRAHGQIVEVSKPFRVGRSKLMYPGDPRGPGSETTNCRCSMVTIYPEVGAITTPLDARIKKERKRRVGV